MARGDLTDEQWAALAPLLPTSRKADRPAVWSRRQLINGIRFRVRTGVPWRACRVRAVGPGLRPVPPMAAGRHLVPGSRPAPVPGRCGRRDRLGPESRLHGVSCPSACVRGPQAR
ncbi:transposase [Streptomyces sp. B6(2022)]|uniref:transposase n=1 Tax=Streptomyces sp. B6(2022) TaxID=3404749 RepID=UPI003AF0D6C0